MTFIEQCEIEGCLKEATRITSTETRYIVVCEECWHERYRK